MGKKNKKAEEAKIPILLQQGKRIQKDSTYLIESMGKNVKGISYIGDISISINVIVKDYNDFISKFQLLFPDQEKFFDFGKNSTFSEISYTKHASEAIQSINRKIDTFLIFLECLNSKTEIIISIDTDYSMISKKIAGSNATEKERTIIAKNLRSIEIFEKSKELKFATIAMGSILEYLLIKYCKKEGIKPENYNGKEGDSFANYIQAAINKDLFGEKKRWNLVQNHIRDFRNYIHLEKEIQESSIDQAWFDTVKPVFDAILTKFSEINI